MTFDKSSTQGTTEAGHLLGLTGFNSESGLYSAPSSAHATEAPVEMLQDFQRIQIVQKPGFIYS